MVHSTTPWVAKGRYVYLRSNCIAICDTDNNPPEVMEGNAEFIARSANSHKPLVDALMQAQAWMERVMAAATGGTDVPDVDYATNWNVVSDQITEALSVAGKRE